MRLRYLVISLFLLHSLLSLSFAQTPSLPEASETTPLVVWIPDRLTPVDSTAWTLLREQTQTFSEASGIEIDLRLKRVNDVGGIMSTLRSASIAAPAAMPDLTLFRRQDLLVAEREGLIQSIDGRVPASLIVDLGQALGLGQVNQTLYGLPYMLDMEHVVYRPLADIDYSAWDYDAVLERGRAFAFVGSFGTGLSDVFLVQYVAEGGSFNPDGTLSYNAEALRGVLSFYAQARQQDLISPQVLDYLSPLDFMDEFQNQSLDMMVVNSSLYLAGVALDSRLRPAPIPTHDGRESAIINGWMWSLVSTTPERQDAAMRYATWLMDVNRQQAFADISLSLPSTRSALQNTSLPAESAPFYRQLLSQALLPIPQAENSTLTRGIQDALSAVINQSHTVDEALAILEAQISQLPPS